MNDERWSHGSVYVAGNNGATRAIAHIATRTRISELILWPVIYLLVRTGVLVKVSAITVECLFRYFPRGKDEPIGPFVEILTTRPRPEVRAAIRALNLPPSSEKEPALCLELFRWKVERETGVGSTSGINNSAKLREFKEFHRSTHFPLPLVSD